MKKTFVVLIAVIIMCLSLTGCGGDSQFSEVVKYVIENGEQEAGEGEIRFVIPLETDDSNIMGPVYLAAITTDGTEATCNTLEVFTYDGNPDNPSLNYLYINNETNIFKSVYYWSKDETQLVQKDGHIVEEYRAYHVAESEIDTYTRETELYGTEYQCVTDKVLRSDVYVTMYPEEVLDRLENGLSRIGFSVADLGFAAFEPGTTTIEENVRLYGN